MGVSAAGIAGALAMSPDAHARRRLASTLGRDVTQYGVRPGSPDDQTQNCSARSMKPRARKCRWRCRRASIAPACCAFNGTQLVGVRGATKLVFSGGASMLQSEGAGSVGLTGITFDGGGIPLPSGAVSCIASAGATSVSPTAK